MTTTIESGQRFKLTIAYDGRSYRGWQTQPEGQTIQDELLAAIRKISPEIREVKGSGRTDAGVSAIAQTAHFDAVPGWRMDAVSWQKAINTKLPRTIRIMEAEPIDSDFHARFSAIGKEYRYSIDSGKVLSPLDLGRVWHVPLAFDMDLLEQALAAFVGTHDFTNFSANRGDGSDEGADRVRRLDAAEISMEQNRLVITLRGNGFLYKMVRFIVGSAIRVAQSIWSQEQLEEALANPDQSGAVKAIFCAPADGLVLSRVIY